MSGHFDSDDDAYNKGWSHGWWSAVSVMAFPLVMYVLIMVLKR